MYAVSSASSVAQSNSASADHAGYVDAGTDLCGLNTTPADYFVEISALSASTPEQFVSYRLFHRRAQPR